MINSFLIALQFLTIIPIKIKDASKKKIAESMSFFPFAGAVIGIGAFGIYYLASYLHLGPLISSIFTVIYLTVITGGLHLDGLADTFDALASNNDIADKLTIMRDSCVGVMGVLALISVILLKIFLLCEITSFHKFSALLAMLILSRYAQILAIRTFTYARSEGKARVFFLAITNKIFFCAFFSALAFVILLLRAPGLYLFIAANVSAFFLGRFLSNNLGGLTGDTLGAISEITEVIVLFTAIIIQFNF